MSGDQHVPTLPMKMNFVHKQEKEAGSGQISYDQNTVAAVISIPDHLSVLHINYSLL